MISTKPQYYICVFQIRLHGITEVPQSWGLEGRRNSKLLTPEQIHLHLFYMISSNVYSVWKRVQLFVFKLENCPTTCWPKIHFNIKQQKCLFMSLDLKNATSRSLSWRRNNKINIHSCGHNIFTAALIMGKCSALWKKIIV